MQAAATDTAHHDAPEMNVHHVPGYAAFTATNVLSREECLALVAAGESSQFRCSGEAGGPRFAGNRSRATFLDPSTAATLFQRLGPVIPTSHTHDSSLLDEHHLLGPDVPSGNYAPVAVNEFMRISKYESSLHHEFRKHTDTAYCRDEHYVGFWTLLLYLNDDFEGGETVLYDYCDDGWKDEEVFRVTPEIGKVFAFYHYQLHAGLRVASSGGTKLCLRTEIMFGLQNRIDD